MVKTERRHMIPILLTAIILGGLILTGVFVGHLRTRPTVSINGPNLPMQSEAGVRSGDATPRIDGIFLSPDTRWVAVSIKSYLAPPYRLFMVDPKKERTVGSITSNTDPFIFGQWDLDGEHFYFIHPLSGVYRARYDGTGVTRLPISLPHQQPETYWWGVRQSPDGQNLVVTTAHRTEEQKGKDHFPVWHGEMYQVPSQGGKAAWLGIHGWPVSPMIDEGSGRYSVLIKERTVQSQDVAVIRYGVFTWPEKRLEYLTGPLTDHRGEEWVGGLGKNFFALAENMEGTTSLVKVHKRSGGHEEVGFMPLADTIRNLYFLEQDQWLLCQGAEHYWTLALEGGQREWRPGLDRWIQGDIQFFRDSPQYLASSGIDLWRVDPKAGIDRRIWTIPRDYLDEVERLGAARQKQPDDAP